MKKPVLLLLIVLSFGAAVAQKTSVWHEVSRSQTAKLARVRTDMNEDGEKYFSLDANKFKLSLVNAKDRFNKQSDVVVEFPNMDGSIEKFKVWENSNMTPEFQAQFPQIRAYVGKSLIDGSTINFSVSPQGVQTILYRPDGDVEFIEAYDKEATAYVLFDSKSRGAKHNFTCSTVDTPLNISNLENKNNTDKSSLTTFKTMKLALSCTAEYSNYFGATSSANVALVLAAMNATITRVNSVMEKDLAVHLNMIDNTNVIFYNASTDPYDAATAGAGGTWNAQLMNTLHAASYNASGTGDAAFDIGHLFGATGGGGNAGCIGCVCSNDMTTDSTGSPQNYKGSGFTSPGIDATTNTQGPPSGDTFDIDYVVHEMGHQLGANHSFTFSSEGTVAQTEPGSGSTIMGYAGITSYDVQNHSDAIYSYKNINQIQTNLNTKTCPVSVTMTDNVPVVNAGADYTIPQGTAFMLTGTASDPDANDVLTYLWEQNDVGSSSASANASSEVKSTKTTGPTFRTFKPSTNKFRYFPEMSKILAGTISRTTASLTYWETVSTVARALNFTFTARDNAVGGGKTATDAAVITVSTAAGPFTVTSQATSGISYAGLSTQTVTWNVASTTAAPFNAATVDILLSTNVSTANEGNGNTSSSPNPTTWTTIASAVPNNGSYVVTLPNVTATTSTCRFMVKAVGNVFLAVNSTNFTITPALSAHEFGGLDNFSLFPNPNTGNFTVKFDSTSTNDIDIIVHDIRGRNVFEKTYTNTGVFAQNLQLDNVQAGIYLVTVKDGDRKVVKKIVVE